MGIKNKSKLLKLMIFAIALLSLGSNKDPYKFTYVVKTSSFPSYAYYKIEKKSKSNSDLKIRFFDRSTMEAIQLCDFKTEIIVDSDTSYYNCNLHGEIIIPNILTSFRIRVHFLDKIIFNKFFGVNNYKKEYINDICIVLDRSFNLHNYIIYSKRELTDIEINGIINHILTGERNQLIDDEVCKVMIEF
jgi:hypothetical protein